MPPPSQFSLFNDEPRPTSLVQAVGRGAPADKAQAAFRRLVAKLEARRETLRTWQAYGERYRQRLADELLPAQKAFRQARKEMACLLDELLSKPGGAQGKHQRRKLSRLVLDLTRDLLLEGADPELEALHDRHAGERYADLQDEGRALSQAMVEELMGVELGRDHGAKTLEEMVEQARRQLHAREQQAAARRRRKSAKSEAAAARREQAAQEASQSIREVYRKLASALHPDREPDPAQRQAKTALMQRANRAYEAGDLLDLLNLQLQIEQIDADHLANLPEQRLAHYTQVLREQVAELDKEIESLIAPFRMIVMELPNLPLTPAAVDRSLDAEIARLGRDEAETQADMEGFRDPRQRARMLKTYEPDDGNAEELAELLELTALFDQMGGPSGPGRGKPAAGGKRKKKTRRS